MNSPLYATLSEFLKWLIVMRQWILFALVINFCIIFSIVYGLHRYNYCISEFRFVSDSETYNAAILDWVFNKNWRRVALDDGNRTLAKNYAQENPNCCELLSGDVEKDLIFSHYSFFDVAFGYVSRLVRLEKLKSSPGEQTVISVYNVPISSCARREHEAYGYDKPL